MNNGCSSKRLAKSKKMNSKKLKEDSDEETEEQKQVAENKNTKTEANEDKGSHGASDKKDKNEKNIGCCTKCKAKSNKMKSKKLKEESDEEDEKESILTWRHKSTKKEKGHGVNPPYQTGRSMYQGGPNPSNRWNMYAPPRGFYPAFAKGPMYGQCSGGGGCGGGPFQPYQPMNPAAMYNGAHISPYPLMAATMYNGAHMSPYPPMAPALFPPYMQARPFTDANPMTRYTSYADNYSYFFI